MKPRHRNSFLKNAIILVAFLVGISVFGWRQNNGPQQPRPAEEKPSVDSVAPNASAHNINASAAKPQPSTQPPAAKPQPSTQPPAAKPQPSTQPPAAKPDNAPSKPAVVPQVRWHRSNLERHWEKHGAEFPEYHSAQEYGDGALRFFQNPPQGTLTKVRPNGEKLYYHPPSNTFGATAPDGTPKTLFRPSGRMNYWNRQ
ncbi:MAG: hypothetical protein IKP00_09555 [Victivallales bacterium]|nr:hypothetical protein [Victivallales bacterium]